MMERLKEHVLPEAIRVQAFGPDVIKFVEFRPNATEELDQYMSDIIFGDVLLENPKGELLKESVVIKVHPDRQFASNFDISSHFHNEVLFYRDIVPFFKKFDKDGFLTENIPEFIYGRATGRPEDDVVILRDLTKRGFRMTEERLFLDEKHVKLALDRLAKYHALSFKSLHEDPDGFHALATKIQARSIKNSGNSKLTWNRLKLRGIDPLKSDPKYKDRLEDVYKHCENAITWMESIKHLRGPMNILVRGDCTRNNLMFKYRDGEPVEVVFIDWACMRHSTMVIDLGVLLTLNISPDTKRLHWDDYLHAYHTALSRQLEGYPVISYGDLAEEMRCKGVYGYHWSVFLLPAALEESTKDRFESMDDDERMRYLLEFGGPKATEYLSEIIKFMLDRNFVFEY